METATHQDKISRMKSLVINRNYSVYDPQFTKALKAIPWGDWHDEPRPFFCREQYLEKFPAWIASSRLNAIRGLDRFRERHLINGTTQTFDEAYFVHKNRRLRVFRGEYPYHRRVARENAFLEDEPLAENDYVIVSAPFSATGELHPKFYELLREAGRLEVPVIVDCAYFGTCLGFELDLNFDCIESVSFSLSKGLGLGDIRSGIRFSNISDDNPICQHNRFNHSVMAAARIGLYMMEKFSPDHVPNRFREIQLEVCREIGVAPSSCMHIALGGPEWSHFRVDDAYNTLGIRELVKARYKKAI